MNISFLNLQSPPITTLKTVVLASTSIAAITTIAFKAFMQISSLFAPNLQNNRHVFWVSTYLNRWNYSDLIFLSIPVINAGIGLCIFSSYRTANQNNRTMEALEKSQTAVKPSQQAIFHSYQQAVKAGLPEAMKNLGNCYYKGFGVPKDDRQAAYWYQEAAKRGLASGMYNLALFLDKGLGIDKNPEQASWWYTRAAEKGHIGALEKLSEKTGASSLLICTIRQLGDHYFKGAHQNDEKAFKWYKEGADKKDLHCMHRLAFCYDVGIGTEENSRKAFTLYLDAANAGNRDSMHSLGNCYYLGEGISKDMERAAYWYKKAADLGHSTAKENLKKCQS